MISRADLEQALSLERFGRYLGWAAGDRARAIELYTLNAKVSESLYIPLQTLEVVLRNRIHSVMTGAFHDNWFHESGVLVLDAQSHQLTKAIEDIAAGEKQPASSQIVAALTFSFWTSMFGKEYESLWQTTLHSIARRQDGKGLTRKDFSGPLTPIRTLRNRIAHHEPIITWNLPRHYGKVVELTRWMSPPAADWCIANNRFAEVYPTERIVLHTGASTR